MGRKASLAGSQRSYGPEGRGFESLRVYQLALTIKMQAKIPHFRGVAIRKHEKTQ